MLRAINDSSSGCLTARRVWLAAKGENLRRDKGEMSLNNLLIFKDIALLLLNLWMT